MPAITSVVARRRLSALRANLSSSRDVAAAARVRNTELIERKSQLEQRQDDEERRSLPAINVVDSALATALLDDPTITIDGDALAAAAESDKRNGAERAEQESRLAVVRAAIVKVDMLIAQAGRELAEAERREREADDDLRSAAYEALADEFRSRFKVLSAEVIDPLLVLQSGMRGAHTHLDTDSRVVLNTWRSEGDGLGGYLYEALLDQSPNAGLERHARSEEVIASFFDSLGDRRTNH